MPHAASAGSAQKTDQVKRGIRPPSPSPCPSPQPLHSVLLSIVGARFGGRHGRGAKRREETVRMAEAQVQAAAQSEHTVLTNDHLVHRRHGKFTFASHAHSPPPPPGQPGSSSPPSTNERTCKDVSKGTHQPTRPAHGHGHVTMHTEAVMVALPLIPARSRSFWFRTVGTVRGMGMAGLGVGVGALVIEASSCQDLQSVQTCKLRKLNMVHHSLSLACGPGCGPRGIKHAAKKKD
jgi:hypothetical protein